LQLLGRRPLTAEELQRKLEQKGFDGAARAEALAALESEGLLDDGGLALHYILVRSERLGHGRERLVRELIERGVARETAEQAWTDAVDGGSLDPERLLARQARLRLEREGGRLDLQAYRRVYNSLLRAGFEARSIRAQLDPFRDFPDGADGGAADGLDHDLA
jgi:regulatory protein